MRPWLREDWEFTLTVLQGEARQCRIGLETGDEFTFHYALPAGICPKTVPHLHTLCEIIRCGGDFTHRGSPDMYRIDFPCADGVIRFRLEGRRLPHAPDDPRSHP